ncbi:MAG: CRTAC1 family protein [Nitrospiraceae bacterium]
MTRWALRNRLDDRAVCLPPARSLLKQKKRAGCYAVVLLVFFEAVGAGSEEPSVQPGMPVRLVDVAQEAGVMLVNISGGPRKNYLLDVAGNGAAFFDYDNDNDMDLLVVNGSTFGNFRRGGDPMVTLYRNSGDGKFSDVTNRSGLNKKGWGQGVCVADYDNDGYQDFYITGYGSNALFRNQGNGTFDDVTEQAGVADGRWSTSCAFGDYDRDGHVDLYVANYVFLNEEITPVRGTADPICKYMGKDVMCGPRGLPGQPDALYRNSGDGTFTDVTESAGIRDPGYYGLGVIFSDLDNDGWLDIYVANDSNPNFLFRNNRDGTFSEIALEAEVALSEEGLEQAGMGLAVGDYNNDGSFDIFVTNFSQDTNTLYQNEGEGLFGVMTYLAGLGVPSLPYLAWGTGFVDLDNDGFLDIFIANGHIYSEIDQFALGSTFRQPNQLYRNLGNGRFIEVTEQVGGSLLVKQSSRGVAFGDYDNDGDLDILITNLDERPVLLRTDSTNHNHWITLRLVGTKSNRDAIGARVAVQLGDRVLTAEVRSGGSYLSHNDSRIHFGLGDETRIQRLEVRWPSGLVETFGDLSADRFFLVREGQGVTEIEIPARKES